MNHDVSLLFQKKALNYVKHDAWQVVSIRLYGFVSNPLSLLSPSTRENPQTNLTI
jgi:hypothetical protein